jgi:hypothetical protein
MEKSSNDAFSNTHPKRDKVGDGQWICGGLFVNWDHLIFKDLKRYVTMIYFLVL